MLRKQRVIKQLEKNLTTANGKRRERRIPENAAEEIYGVFIKYRKLVKSYGHDPDTVMIIYAPFCLPNCYRYPAKTTAAGLSTARIKSGAPLAWDQYCEKRPRGRKWSWKITFTPNTINAVPEGFNSAGVMRI